MLCNFKIRNYLFKSSSKVIFLLYKYLYDIPISRISNFPSGSVHSLLDVVPWEQDASEWSDSGGKPCVLRMVGLEVARIAAHHCFLYVEGQGAGDWY